MHRTPVTSGAARKSNTPVTPSPSTTTAAAQDAARTFIRRPNTKRRSLENMETYKKRQDTYAAISSGQLLQDLMKTFEDIPSKVQEYPQMRRDIKAFLEAHSDKGLKALFELSSRIQKLEAQHKAAEAPSTTASSDGQEGVLKRLGEMEAALTERIGEMEQTIQADLQGLDVSANERVDNLFGKIHERLYDVNKWTDDTANVIEERTNDLFKELVSGVTEEVVTAKKEIVEVAKGLTCASSAQLPVPVQKTYASAAASRPTHRPALHSVAVTLEGNQETADEVLARVKRAVDARKTGLKITKVRKARNQTIILGCDTAEELKRVHETIESRGGGLKVAPMKNKNPLVILKDVYTESEEDDDFIGAIYAQNKEVFEGLPEGDAKIELKFKKRTKNPKTKHIILQVGPIVWQRMTETGALYLDLQRVRVEDQSPLIQCTRCLAYGHGRKFCTESVDRCSHCGGPHLRGQCVELIAGNAPQCCNCSHSGLQKTDHNAFDTNCPVRKKWDYLARANTTYA